MVQVRSIMSRPRRADPRHVAEHDLVTALGHDRQVGPRLVRPHAEPEEAEAEPVADRLDLFEVPAAFGAALVEVLERRARQLELAGGLQADRAVDAGQRDDLAALFDRLPAELGQAQQEVADAARLFPGRRAMVADAIDELLMLGADPPVLARLLAAGEHGQQIVAVFDQRARRKVGTRVMKPPSRVMPRQSNMVATETSASPRPAPSRQRRRPARPSRRAGCAGRG